MKVRWRDLRKARFSWKGLLAEIHGRVLTVVFALALFVTLPLQAAPELKGRLVLVGAGEQDKQSVPNVKVTVLEYGNSTTTNDEGVFRLALPDGVRGGQEITLSQDKKDYAIYVPLFGKQRLPDHWTDIIEVRLLPKGSKLFWTDRRIEEFIERVANESPKKGTLSDGTQAADLATFIVRLGQEYGFSPKDVRAQIGDWLKVAKDDSTNFRRRGLASFAEKRFSLAAENFLESARRHQNEASQDTELAGDSYFNTSDYRKAIECYEAAIRNIQSDVSPTRRDSLMLKLSSSQRELAEQSDPSKARPLLLAASSHLHELEQRRSRVQDPTLWADLQFTFGLVLSSQSKYAVPEEARVVRHAAVQALDESIRVYASGSSRDAWVVAQNALGLVLTRQAVHEHGDNGTTLVSAAIDAFNSALTVTTKDEQPTLWAILELNLGNALRCYSERYPSGSAAAMRHAVDSFENALSALTKETEPRAWVTALNGLGHVLRLQAEQTSDADSAQLFDASIKASRKALSVATKDSMPTEWANCQLELGQALIRYGARGSRETSADVFSEAVQAFRDALLVRTRQADPQGWGATQLDLGTALAHLATCKTGKAAVDLFSQSEQAFELALGVFSVDGDPALWATVHNNIGLVLQQQSDFTGASESIKKLSKSIEHFELSLKVRTSANLPRDFAITKRNMGTSLRLLAVRSQEDVRKALLNRSKECFNDALGAIDEHDAPRLNRALLENLADTLWEQFVCDKDWVRASKGIDHVVRRYSRDRRIYSIASSICQEKMFLFDKAFVLHKSWCDRHPEDIDAAVHFAESHFTTGRFDECSKRIDRILKDPRMKAEASMRSVLMVLRASCSLAGSRTQEFKEVVRSLMKHVEQQSEQFRTNWEWSGTRRFVDTTEISNVVMSRMSLTELIDAVSSKDRDDILKRLRPLQLSP